MSLAMTPAAVAATHVGRAWPPRGTMVLGLLSKTLTYALLPLPRWGRARAGMVDHVLARVGIALGDPPPGR